jgi:predicted ATP-dependent endonuclease of OLD family
MKLVNVTILKYKSFLQKQEMKIEPFATCIVGKNESGKSAILECLAKVNYFDEADERFKFNETFDYPKNEWKTTAEPSKTKIVTLEYKLDDSDIAIIDKDLGEGIRNFNSFSITRSYDGSTLYSGINTKIDKYLEKITNSTDIPEESLSIVKEAKTLQELKLKVTEIKPDSRILADILKIENGAYKWENLLDGYTAKSLIDKLLPVFWYFDEYLSLPGRIDLNKVASQQSDVAFTADNLKISKALIELSKIDINDLVKTTNYEA